MGDPGSEPGVGLDRIRYQLEGEGVLPVPGRRSIYRALVRNGRVDPAKRRRRRADYRRWERGRPMELWQMDVVGGIHLADRVEVKCVTGIDDNSRFVVSAMLMPRAAARPVCEALLAALRRHGIPEQILTDIHQHQEREPIAPFQLLLRSTTEWTPGAGAREHSELGKARRGGGIGFSRPEWPT